MYTLIYVIYLKNFSCWWVSNTIIQFFEQYEQSKLLDQTWINHLNCGWYWSRVRPICYTVPFQVQNSTIHFWSWFHLLFIIYLYLFLFLFLFIHDKKIFSIYIDCFLYVWRELYLYSSIHGYQVNGGFCFTNLTLSLRYCNWRATILAKNVSNNAR